MRHIDAIIVFIKTADFFHAVTLRHVLRSVIVVADYRINFVCTQIFKGVVFAGNRRFRGETLVPIVGAE